MSHNAGGRHGYYPAGPYPVPPPSTTVTAPGGGQPGAAQMKNAFESFLNSQGHLPPPSTASASAPNNNNPDAGSYHQQMGPMGQMPSANPTTYGYYPHSQMMGAPPYQGYEQYPHSAMYSQYYPPGAPPPPARPAALEAAADVEITQVYNNKPPNSVLGINAVEQAHEVVKNDATTKKIALSNMHGCIGNSDNNNRYNHVGHHVGHNQLLPPSPFKICARVLANHTHEEEGDGSEWNDRQVQMANAKEEATAGNWHASTTTAATTNTTGMCVKIGGSAGMEMTEAQRDGELALQDPQGLSSGLPPISSLSPSLLRSLPPKYLQMLLHGQCSVGDGPSPMNRGFPSAPSQQPGGSSLTGPGSSLVEVEQALLKEAMIRGLINPQPGGGPNPGASCEEPNRKRARNSPEHGAVYGNINMMPFNGEMDKDSPNAKAAMQMKIEDAKARSDMNLQAKLAASTHPCSAAADRPPPDLASLLAKDPALARELGFGLPSSSSSSRGNNPSLSNMELDLARARQQLGMAQQRRPPASAPPSTDPLLAQLLARDPALAASV